MTIAVPPHGAGDDETQRAWIHDTISALYPYDAGHAWLVDAKPIAVKPIPKAKVTALHDEMEQEIRDLIESRTYRRKAVTGKGEDS